MSANKPRVAINGFGRIGRTVFRILGGRTDLDVVAINDLTDPETLAYLCRYDTVHGKFPGPVELVGDYLQAGSHDVRILSETDPRALPWGELEIDIVVEATGVFREREQIARHLEAGAQRVILTVPAKDEIDATVVIGVNDDVLRSTHRLVSAASCTTKCLAPLAMVLHERVGMV